MGGYIQQGIREFIYDKVYEMACMLRDMGGYIYTLGYIDGVYARVYERV